MTNNLNASVSRSGASIHREVAKCSASLSNQLSAIKATSSEVAPSAKLGVRKVTSESSGSRNSNSGAGSKRMLM